MEASGRDATKKGAALHKKSRAHGTKPNACIKSGRDATKKGAALHKKSRAHGTKPNACIKPHLAYAKNLSSAKPPPIEGLYVVFATKKPAASRCFRHLSEL